MIRPTGSWVAALSAAAGGIVSGGGFQKGYTLRAVNVFIRQMPEI